MDKSKGKVAKGDITTPSNYLAPTGNPIGQNRSMYPSGTLGGTPMLSKDGKQTISNYICFSNGIKMKDKPKFDFNASRIPLNEIEKKVR